MRLRASGISVLMFALAIVQFNVVLGDRPAPEETKSWGPRDSVFLESFFQA